MYGEILSIHIGQAGIQLGNSCWELLCLEHGISPNGQQIPYTRVPGTEDVSNRFFRKTGAGKYVPRAMYIDLEPTVIDQTRVGNYRELFSSEMMIAGKEDGANNYARGRYSIGREMIKAVGFKLRKTMEFTDQLQGFLIYHSLGGGTGSGFTSLLMELLEDNYKKKVKLEVGVLPSPNLSSAVVEPYNALLSTHAVMDQSDCCFIIDNEAIFKICRNKLNIQRPTFININRLIAQVISSVTASLRFTSYLNISLKDLQTNLVPFPRIHYPLISYSPMTSFDTARSQQYTAQILASECFEPRNQMISVDPRCGKYMAACMLFRGHVHPKDINQAILSLKRKKCIKFVEWCPTGFKVGINNSPPTMMMESDLASAPISCCMLSNSTAIADAWYRIGTKFDLMYKRKAFVHWYQKEGLLMDEFEDAREDTAALINDYDEVAGRSL